MIETLQLSSWTARDFQAGGRPASLAILCSPESSPSDAWLHHAATIIHADPRVASVSAAGPAIRASAASGRQLLDEPRAASGTAFASEPVGSHILINTAVWELTGPLEESAGQVRIEDGRRWAARANHRGLRHVWVLQEAGAQSATPPIWPFSEADARELDDPLSGLSLVRDRWIAGNCRLRIGVEASWLQDNETGAQVATVCWLEALAERADIESIRLIGLPGGRVPSYAPNALRSGKVVVAGPSLGSPDDVYWRPYQPDATTMLSRDRALGGRVATTVLDLIEFANERYHPGAEQWAKRRQQLRRYLRQSDMLTGISQDVMDTLEIEVPGLESARMRRTALGVDHLRQSAVADRPAWLSERCAALGDRPFLLVLGNDFVHKNRDFAIRVWQSVCKSTDVDLVLAGLHVSSSSTGDIEERLLAQGPSAPSRVHVLRHVPGEVKSWLLSNTAVVLYPTSAEGFGFIPHEAADLGAPSLFTDFGPLGEFCTDPPGVATWDAHTYADRVLQLLQDQHAHADAVERARAADAGLTWAASAETLVEAFRAALRLAPQPYGLWERTDGPLSGRSRSGDPNDSVDLAAARRAAVLSGGWRPLARRARNRWRRLAGRD